MSLSLLDEARKRVKELGGVWHGGYGMACCPAHDDRTPSLSVRPGRSAVLYHCFAGCSHEAVLTALGQGIGVAGRRAAAPSAPAARRDLAGQSGGREQLVQAIWTNALPLAGTPGAAYFAKRGLRPPAAARYEPSAVTYIGHGQYRRSRRLRAIILPLFNERGLTAVQRIFIAADGSKADVPSPKKLLGTRAGGAVRLGTRPERTLNIAEGVEDAAAAMELLGLDHCWAACGIEAYASLDIPQTVRRIVIYSQYGDEAERAIRRAHAALCADGRSLDVILPPAGGDWNDALLAQGDQAAPVSEGAE